MARFLFFAVLFDIAFCSSTSFAMDKTIFNEHNHSAPQSPLLEGKNKSDKYRSFITAANYTSIGLSALAFSKAIYDLRSNSDIAQSILFVLFAPEVATTSLQSANQKDDRNLYKRNLFFLGLNTLYAFVAFTEPGNNLAALASKGVIDSLQSTIGIVYVVSFAVKAIINLANVVYKKRQENHPKNQSKVNRSALKSRPVLLVFKQL